MSRAALAAAAQITLALFLVLLLLLLASVTRAQGTVTGNGSISIAAGGPVATPASALNGAGCPINTVPGGPTDPVTAFNCPLPNATGAGNLLAVLLRWNSSNTPTVTFTDNVGGNTYLRATSCLDSGSATNYALYYVQSVAAGVRVVTSHFSANSSFVQEDVFEFYNAGALDQATCQVATGSAISAGTFGTISATNDLVLQFAVSNGTAITACTLGSQSNITWTMRMALIAGPEPACGQFGVYAATSPFAPAMSVSTSVPYISVAAAFRAASAGTAPPGGIRVAYVQHDDGGEEENASLALQLPVSGDLIAELNTAGCASTTLSSCAYATAMSDGTNTWAQVGSTFVSSTGSSQEAVGAIWYAKNVTPGLYPLAITMHGRPSSTFPLSWILYDIVGANTSTPLDTGFGGGATGLAALSVNQPQGTGGPFTTFTVTPSFTNEAILTEVGTEWNTYTGTTSPTGAQFLSANYIAETNFSWADLNGGWGLLYNNSSLSSQTWIWSHDASQFAGAGRGVALGVAFH